MKYRFIILFAFVGLGLNNAFCQSETNTRKNIVYTEVAGAVVVGYGLGYERYITIDQSKRVSLRGGGGIINHFNDFTSFMGGSFILGRKSSLEIGLNYLVNYDDSTFQGIDEPIGRADERFKNDWQTLIGYRYQNWENGIIFRVFYVPPAGCCGSYIPIFGGASLGYAF